MKKNILLTSLTCLFVLLLTATAYVSFSGNIAAEEVTVNSITPIYDETSGIIVTRDKVTFNDKNQVVDYKVLIENTQNYDVKINNISLTTPTEEFLSFEVEDIQENDVVKASSTKEITISFETMGIEGWGRNFSDELTANISFEKVSKQEEVVPPKEEEQPKEEDKPTQEETPNEETPEQEKPSKPSEGGQSSKPIPQPEAPIKDEKELIKNVEKIEEVVVTSNTIELPKEIKVSVGEKIAVWIYSEPIFLGYFDVVVENGVKKIEGLEEALSKADIKVGDHNIVLVSNEETIGYIPVSINENKELITEDNKRDEAIENPYTNDNILLIALITATSLTGLSIVVLSQKNTPKYMLFAIILGSTLIPTNAEQSIELLITFNVNFESQNVMKASGCSYDQASDSLIGCVDYWEYRKKIKTFYIQNKITEVSDVVREFDATEDQNNRVKAYLVKNKDDSNYYDLYLQADGIIYANANSNHYFSEMENIDEIVNLKGIDTSQVTSMRELFYHTGAKSENFTLDVSSLDTSNVTTMKHMFTCVGYNSTKLILDVSNFDTSNVTDMSSMFDNAGYNSLDFTLDVSGFDTSKVTTMHGMFNLTGYSNPNFTLDVSNFDTSKVVRTSRMFDRTGGNSTKFNTSITISNPNISDYANMFNETTTKPGSQIKVNYTAETEELVKKMIATKSPNSNVVLGNLIVDVDNLSIGDEIHISGEKFNVISQDDDNVTMLAKYNLGTDYKQTTTENSVVFSETYGWDYTPGPKEIDIQVWSTNSKTYITEYIEYLKNKTDNSIIKGNLITLKELETLGCIIPSNYKWIDSGWDCNESTYKDWLVNEQRWWTKSAYANNSKYIWIVNDGGYLGGNSSDSNNNGIRPTITISKEALKGLNS